MDTLKSRGQNSTQAHMLILQTFSFNCARVIWKFVTPFCWIVTSDHKRTVFVQHCHHLAVRGLEKTLAAVFMFVGKFFTQILHSH